MERGGAICCRVCGQSASAGARFCRRCGARLPCPPADALRRDQDDDERKALEEDDR